jgi:Ser/Thr protein kinase RdoA (MazF antagonist)
MHGDIKNNNIVFDVKYGFRLIDFNLTVNYGKSIKFLKE